MLASLSLELMSVACPFFARTGPVPNTALPSVCPRSMSGSYYIERVNWVECQQRETQLHAHDMLNRVAFRRKSSTYRILFARRSPAHIGSLDLSSQARSGISGATESLWCMKCTLRTSLLYIGFFMADILLCMSVYSSFHTHTHHSPYRTEIPDMKSV